MSLGLTDLIAGIFRPAAELIDAVHTSEEERLAAQGQLLVVQATVLDKALAYEKGVLEAQASIINSEAQSESWLARNWRPITMLTFLTLIVGRALGWLEADFKPEEWERFFRLIEIGLGGYVLGRSAEKITKTVVAARDSKTQ